jgi:hypothetical protein
MTPDLTAQASINSMYANPTMVRVPRYVYYKVRKTDNIFTIAAHYGVSVAKTQRVEPPQKQLYRQGAEPQILTFPEVPSYQAQTAPAAQTTTVAVTQAPSAVGDTTSGAASEQVLYYYEQGKTDTTKR